ncbi:MAG: EAL domain-containing protein [Pseudobutyrivibrio sp.]|mgnify:FL=1|nr:EAL domain-containing protein [Pseudobutyrivibrio sp.]
MVVTGSIFIIFLMRRSYMGKSSILYLSTVVCNFFAALFDVFSCFGISNTDRTPVALNYFFLLGYLFFYNMMSVLYFLYIDHKGKLEHMRVPVKVAAISMTVFYVFAIFLTPFTHLIAYFRPDGTYCHGPLIWVIWILPFITFVWELVIFYQARSKFSAYQFVSAIGIIISTALAITVSIISPKLLLGELVMSVAMIYVYVCYENPANYTFLDTQCLNDIAFMGVMKHMKRKKTPFMLTCFYIIDYDEVSKNLKFDTYTRLNKKIADVLHKSFKRRAFYIENGKFVVLSTDEDMADGDLLEIKHAMGTAIELEGEDYHFNIAVHSFRDLQESYTVADIAALVNYVLNHVEESLSAEDLLKRINSEDTKDKKILAAVKRAIEQDEFKVFYQPIYNPVSGKFKSAEALIRLIDPELGFINPEHMIVIAEKNGLINQVGDMVFEKVCKFISENNLKELGVEYIEVNLSPLQCKRSGLPQAYGKIMNHYNVSPYQLNFEITETAELVDENKTMQNVVDLFVKGIAFSIDDYGSGFASADYLIKLPISLVKIDKTILWSAMKSSQAMIVLKNTIAMAKELGKHIVVEGVEDDEMASVLLDFGVDYNQGFLYSKPIPGEEYVAFLKEQHGVALE